MRLSAPTPAARPRQEDPQGVAGRPALVHREKRLRGWPESGHCPPWQTRISPGTRVRQGHPESVKIPPAAVARLSFSRLASEPDFPFPASRSAAGAGVPPHPKRSQSPGRSGVLRQCPALRAGKRSARGAWENNRTRAGRRVLGGAVTSSWDQTQFTHWLRPKLPSAPQFLNLAEVEGKGGCGCSEEFVERDPKRKQTQENSPK